MRTRAPSVLLVSTLRLTWGKQTLSRRRHRLCQTVRHCCRLRREIDEVPRSIQKPSCILSTRTARLFARWRPCEDKKLLQHDFHVVKTFRQISTFSDSTARPADTERHRRLFGGVGKGTFKFSLAGSVLKCRNYFW